VERAVTWDRIAADWSQFSGRARARWSDLSDDDLEAIRGDRGELGARIARRYALEKEEADKQIDDWLKEPGVLDDWNDRRPILDM
jgi:uncharacterized protein YjbJ (UPF0337 family)